MNHTCQRVDAAVREWESGTIADIQNLFFIINHSRGCPRCGSNYGALLPLIRRDAGERSGLTPYEASPSRDFTNEVMKRLGRTRIFRFSGSVMHTVRGALPLAGAVALLLGVASFIIQANLRAADAVVKVSFTLEAPSASQVSLVGDFTGWRPDALTLKPGRQGMWEITVPIRKGAVYTYNFLIDGQRWVADPHSETQIDDGFGGQASVLRL
jgi:hypothetical protein